MKQNGDQYTLSSGREFYANRGILGVGPDGDVSEGYDGGLYPERSKGDRNKDFTPEERREIADFAIAAWEKFAVYGRPPAEWA